MLRGDCVVIDGLVKRERFLRSIKIVVFKGCRQIAKPELTAAEKGSG